MACSISLLTPNSSNVFNANTYYYGAKVRLSENKNKFICNFLSESTFGSSFSLAKKQTLTLFFFGAKKRGKRNIHLPPSPPYMEGLNRSYSSLVH